MKKQILTLCTLAILAACGDDDDGATNNFTLKGSNDTALSLNSAIASQKFLDSLQNPSKIFATSGIDPTVLKVKVYKFAVSASNRCTNPITVFEDDTPEYVNFYDTSDLDLGAGSLADGEYPCVIVQMSDTLKFKPASTSDNSACVAGTEYTIDVCRSGTFTDDIDSGDSIECDSSENTVSLHLSTASTATNASEAFKAPTSNSDGTNGIALGAALEKSGTTAGLFIVNGDGAIEENGSDCDHQPPTFTFGVEE